jgi:hypothetical protein
LKVGPGFADIFGLSRSRSNFAALIGLLRAIALSPVVLYINTIHQRRREMKPPRYRRKDMRRDHRTRLNTAALKGKVGQQLRTDRPAQLFLASLVA